VTTETTTDKGKDAAEGIDASIVTSDLMAPIKVPFSWTLLVVFL
jgi:hypothetical protein